MNHVFQVTIMPLHNNDTAMGSAMKEDEFYYSNMKKASKAVNTYLMDIDVEPIGYDRIRREIAANQFFCTLLRIGDRYRISIWVTKLKVE